MLRHQGAVSVPEAAMRAAADWAQWPARMQRLGAGPLHDLLPAGSDLWLDGAHNPSAAQPVAKALRAISGGRPVVLIVGMLANKDAAGVLRLLAPVASRLVAVPVPGHAHHAPAALAAIGEGFGVPADTADSLADGINRAAGYGDAVVLIAGSLYLAGEALALNDEAPS